MGERFHVLVVGRPRAKWAQRAVDDYTKRMRRLGGVAEQVVRTERFTGDVDAVRRAEAVRLQGGVRGSLVCLDERGDDLDTEAFAAMVDGLRQRGPVTFALGGAYGHDASTRQAAARTVRLSSLVLNHELARVVLYEQLYRALTLLEGFPYHH
jgi:23S rRNA (pseudouridine1915-N3)-methyltransferase